MLRLKPIIAIDGPAGSGKSTVAKRVAQKLGLFYIDTGAMYRCLALKAQMTKVKPEDLAHLIDLACNLDIRMHYDSQTEALQVVLDGKDVTEDIRKPAITRDVSTIAKIKEVRQHMVGLQRKLAEGKNAILEGRDITTVVFPDAYKKFYLDASAEERIKRRYLELREKNLPVETDEVKNDITNRDQLDTMREHSPLRRAPDAVYLDTTHMTIDEVVNAVILQIQKPA
ncbi:MAG: (d)CMP kinase [Candidatus Omnitrophota bacterium]